MINKKVVIIATIIIVLIVGVIVGIKIKDFKNIIGDFIEENTIDSNANASENDKTNSIKNTTENSENNIINTTDNDEQNNKNIDNHNTTSSKNDVGAGNNSSPDSGKESSEEKALNLVKNKWGKNDNNVYYYVEEQVSDDVFVISVRDKNTTMSLANYEVNIKSEEISEY